ncbi:MAG: hypothetical protein M3007_06495, partial [Candidatus Eremiobacteraeota bacterium]|nr:hypothetical protein [Candidatus Eremiobacteraeota bacterium]
PYVDVIELEYRQTDKTFWDNAHHHLSFTYFGEDGKRSTITLAGKVRNIIPSFFEHRYASDTLNERARVIDSFIMPDVRSELLKKQQERAAPNSNPNQLVDDYATALENYLKSNGVTQESLAERLRERVQEMMERYRGLPQWDSYMKSRGLASATTPSATS